LVSSGVGDGVGVSLGIGDGVGVGEDLCFGFFFFGEELGAGDGVGLLFFDLCR
jgi:hypothetical protein